MATFDQLSAEQKAILELVLRRGQGYGEIATALSLPEEHVRGRARAALESLAPISAQRVESDWRGQISDYVLGQQSGPEATATRGHLRRSEAARTWARSLLDSLETLYADEMPQVPDGGRERAPRPALGAIARPKRESRAEPKQEPARTRPLSPEAEAALRRRRLLGIGGLAALLILLIVLVWPVGVLTGSGGGSESTTRTPASSAIRPTGRAAILEQRGRRAMSVQGQGLQRNTPYVVWLFNSAGDAKAIGAQGSDARGNLSGAGPLPGNYRHYKFIDVALPDPRRPTRYSGSSVLRGLLELLRQPRVQGRGAARVAVLADVRLLPLPSR